MDTVYAPATARGKAGVAVVRISGPLAQAAAASLCGVLPAPRQSAVRRLTHDGQVLDEAVVLVFAAGHSFTGEDVVELHTHGSAAVLSAVLRALSLQPGLRMAEPGEFTRRALENGRLDLAQVEGLADLIDAETEAQRRQAWRVLSGAIGQRASGWRDRMVRAAALIEATIDFADEDVPVDVRPEVSALITGLLTDLRAEVRGAAATERLRDGFEVAIVGAPNVGKSTLLNTLAGREAALTSHLAGTTRDVIEVRMDLRGLPVTLLDTAGLRETDDLVESMGVDRALSRAEAADLRVFLLDGPAMPVELLPRLGDVVLRGKADLRDGDVSGLTGLGVDRLLERIVAELSPRATSSSVITQARHRHAIQRAIEALESAGIALEAEGDAGELVAEDLRQAARAMESLVGKVDAETLLGEIFARFCIGK
ncbi:MAG: tRNA uridine-5-carboxymethylaminomethyl(34) synthesis GTPase MnmE [Gemmobacter sp.]